MESLTLVRNVVEATARDGSTPASARRIRHIRLILADWRAAERQLREAPTCSAEVAAALDRAVSSLREEHHAAFEAVRRRYIEASAPSTTEQASRR